MTERPPFGDHGPRLKSSRACSSPQQGSLRDAHQKNASESAKQPFVTPNSSPKVSVKRRPI